MTASLAASLAAQFAAPLVNLLPRNVVPAGELRHAYPFSLGTRHDPLFIAHRPMPAPLDADEPLSNLDADLRVQMRVELTKLHRALGATMIYVTHDQTEAMTMVDKIVVLNAGRVEQVGSPLDIYNFPANRFVAGFIGSPKMNFLEISAAQSGGDSVTLNIPG